MQYVIPLVDGAYLESEVTQTGTRNNSNAHQIITAINGSPTTGKITIQGRTTGGRWTEIDYTLLSEVEPQKVKSTGQIDEYRFIVEGSPGTGSAIVSDTELGESIQPYAFYGETNGMTPEEVGGAIQSRFNLNNIEFNGLSSSGIDTYSDFIAYIDNAIPSASKENLGVCSNGTDFVFKYTALAGPKNVLIVSGQHGEETLGMVAAMRFFESFANSSTPQMNYLREKYSITWIPVANPSGWKNIAHAGRVNANGVNLNRNYSPAFWNRFDDAQTANDGKGSAPFSEVETQYIKAVIDDIKPFVVADCHNLPADFAANDIMVNWPSSWQGAQMQLSLENAAKYFEYSGFGSWGYLSNRYESRPTLTEFAARYIRESHGIDTAVAFTLEANANLDGSSIYFEVTDSAVAKYCGMLFTLLSFSSSAVSGEKNNSHDWHVWRPTNENTTSITSGGSLIDTTTHTALTWEGRSPNLSATQYDYIEVVAPCNGDFLVSFDGYINSIDSTYARADFKISIDDVEVTHAVSSASLSGAADARTSVVCQHRFPATSDGETTHKIAVVAYKVNVSHGDVKIIYPRLRVEFIPNENVMPTPRLQ